MSTSTASQAPQMSRWLAGLNPAQASAVLAPRTQAVQVLAGAGTGKTELIARRFAQLASDLAASGVCAPDEAAERLLVVTFTNQAADSMRTRISRHWGDTLPETAWVGTFHDIAQRLLRVHGPRLGWPRELEVLDTIGQRRLFRALLEDLRHNRLGDLSDVLARFGLADLRPGLLSVEALHPLSDDALEPLVKGLPALIGRIQASGYTPADFRQAARTQTLALAEALRGLPVAYPLSREPFESPRDACVAWKTHLAPWAAAHWDPLALEAEAGDEPIKASKYMEALAPLGKRLFTYNRSKKRYDPVPDVDWSDLEAATALELAWIEVTAAFYAVYLAALEARGAVDFDGLLQRSVTLLETVPAVAEACRAQFEAVIVDEFQDANLAQLRMLRGLMRTTPPNLTVVGDEKQSIYGFRFAVPENLHLAITGCEPVHTVHLRENYRSRGPILASANPLAQAMTGDPQQTLNPQTRDGPPVVWVTFGQPQPPRTEGGKPREEAIATLREREADWIVAEVLRLSAGGDPDGAAPLLWGDMAVLTKTHSKARAIAEALRSAGVAATCPKTKGFLLLPGVQAAMALLSLLNDPADDLAWVALLQTRLSARTLRQLFRLKTSPRNDSFLSIWQRLQMGVLEIDDLTPAVRAAVDDLVSAVLGMQPVAQHEPPSQWFAQAAERFGLSALDNDQETLVRFQRLLVWLDETGEGQTLARTLAALEAYSEEPDWVPPIEPENGAEEAVTVMTLHGAKGLEFPVVFLALTEKSLETRQSEGPWNFDPQYPGKAGFGLFLTQGGSLKSTLYRQIWQGPRAERELKRLFYVGLTRARDRLYVLRARQSVAWTAADSYLHPAVTVLDEAQGLQPSEGLAPEV